jgi:hypothetical protein
MQPANLAQLSMRRCGKNGLALPARIPRSNVRKAIRVPLLDILPD